MSERAPTDANDPKGLIREAYRIEGITASECRSIFMDWALSLSEKTTPAAAIPALLARYGAEADGDHPMTGVLKEGLGPVVRPARRGGWRSRRRDDAGA